MTFNQTLRSSIVDNLKVRGLFASFLLFLLPWSVPVQAFDWQQQVKQQLLAQWLQNSQQPGQAELELIGVPAEYRLPSCKQALAIDTVRPLLPGRNGIQIQCTSPYWSQTFAIRLKHFLPVVVLKSSVTSGEILSHQDVHAVEMDIGEQNKGYFTDPEPLIGQVVRRSLRPGTVINPDMIEAPDLIKRGEPVTIMVKRPGLMIEMDGTALVSGRRGELIRVRNTRSQKVVSGRVVDTGVVQVQ